MTGARLEPVAGRAGEYRLSGQLDFDSVAALCRDASNAFGGSSPVSIDLAGVEQSNSAGVALLVEWQRGARSRPLTFINVPEQMVAIIKVADLQDVLRLAKHGE